MFCCARCSTRPSSSFKIDKPQTARPSCCPAIFRAYTSEDTTFSELQMILRRVPKCIQVR